MQQRPMTGTAPPNAPSKLIDTNTATAAVTGGSQSASKDAPATKTTTAKSSNSGANAGPLGAGGQQNVQQ